MTEVEGQGSRPGQNPEIAKPASEVERKIAEQDKLMLANLQNIAGNMMPFSDIKPDAVWLKISADSTSLRLLRLGVYCIARYGHCLQPEERL